MKRTVTTATLALATAILSTMAHGQGAETYRPTVPPLVVIDNR